MKDTLLKVFLVILLILIIGLIGLVVYKTVVKDEPKSTNEVQPENNDVDDNQNINESDNEAVYGLNIAQTNFNGVIKAAELGYAKALQTNLNLTDGTCIMNGTSPITCTNGVIVELSGVSPTEGIITFTSGITSVKPGADLKLGDYYCYGDSSSFNCSLTKSQSS